MKKIVASGKTIEDAVKNGLAQLQATKEQVAVTVLEQPSKGLFGLIGTRNAKVELELMPAPVIVPSEERALEAPASVAPAAPLIGDSTLEAGEEAVAETECFVRDVANAMGLAIGIERRNSRDGIVLAVSGAGDVGMLIGRRGQTLDALQYLANIVANRHSDSHIRIVLDAEDFRERRRKTLEELSERLAGRVVRTRKECVLEPMSPQERKIIHSQLQNHPRVKTFSKGDDPNRRVVITLK